MLRALLLALVLLAAAGCGGGGTPEPVPTSVAAIPDVPHVDGPLRLRLQPALTMVSGSSCSPAHGVLCANGEGYRALGQAVDVTATAVRTMPNAEHTAWSTVVRFDGRSGAAARAAARQAAAMGGVLVLVTPDGSAVTAASPAEVGARGARFLGLGKAEAWALVEAFSRSTVGM